ncbi:serine/threonine-protein kinase [Rhodococcus opacus]|uniref:Serine/threonine-protein kinase PknK n=1 Tax=Rhodococcus opacus (strain B4) TaxID=632772 RepID=C1B1U0_RHOOB|nr:serine/threonine-protein kinase [Rhodococcus opacus]BAH50364.1 putative serine/threonine protein kinase [Rhodococcus opacus B4]
MTDFDPLATQRESVSATFTAELSAVGLEDAKEIGHGGFGVVYRCAQPELDRTVAVKVLTAALDPENLERFLREQRAMGRLSGHPHIVNIMQVGTTDTGRPYIVMQYHPHDSLDAQIRRRGPIPWSDALRVGVKLAGALETAHRVGILHRDVKPGNILLTEYGEPQLTDFGIARMSGAFETTAGTVTGSPAFTAPEVLSGRTPTAASDVYSLGATLFSAITGHAAFERHNGEEVIAQFLRITTQPVPDLRSEGFPEDLSAVIQRAMAGKPDDRPASAAAFGDELREVERHHGLAVDEMAMPVDPGVHHSEDTSHGTVSTVSGPFRTSTTGRAKYSSTPPPAPATRFRPPAATRQLVERDRLIDLLRAGRRRLLTVIHGPTGFGKSTLATQWRNVLADEGVAVAWLTVDSDDDNVVWFVAHLIEAIRRVRPNLAKELGQVLEEHDDEAERYVLTSLVNQIHESGERIALIIDDWQRVSEPATIAALEFLLDNGCHHLQVVVTSRTRAGLPMSRMRVKDELVEIDYSELRFDDSEARSFLVDLGGLPLDSEDVTELRDSTDGWVAALQLASLSLRGRADPSELIAGLSGRHHAIGEFLAENVLDTLEPEMLDFLLATSITERTCGSLAGALAGTARGQAMLEAAEDRDLFLRHIDDERTWFRYHTLFAEFLRRRLERDQPDRVRELHRAASRWFCDHSLLREAVEHALAGGEEHRAVELVEADGLLLLEQSQSATLSAVVDMLPPGLVAASARLQVTTAWANAMSHRMSTAERALERAEWALEQTEIRDAAALRAEVGAVRAVIELRADRIERIDDLVADVLAQPESLHPWVVCAAFNVTTFAAVYRFDFAEVRRIQEVARPFYERNKGPHNVVHGQSYLGVASCEQLDIDDAVDRFRRARRAGRKLGGPRAPSARLAGSLLGEVLYERGDIEEAERLLDDGYTLAIETGGVDFKVARFVTGAHVKALRGDREEARKRLHTGLEVAETYSLARLRARVENERRRLGITPHPTLGAPDPVRFEKRRRPVEGIDEIVAQVEEATAVRMLLATGSPANIESAYAWAQEWTDRLAGTGRNRAHLLAERLRVACLAAAGREDEAKQALASIASICAARGLLRILPDGGPSVVALIADLRADQLAGEWPAGRPTVPSDFLEELQNSTSPYTM